jgi:hypothetical protein
MTCSQICARAALASALLLASAPFSFGQTTDALDGFLEGLLPECEGSLEFNRFRKTLAERHGFNFDGSRVNPRRQVAIPESVRPLIGRAVARNKGEYTHVVVPLKGKFRSLAVTALEFSFGNENGINALVVVFAEPPQRVRAVLGAAVADGARRPKAMEARGEHAGGVINIGSERGRTTLVCDIST